MLMICRRCGKLFPEEQMIKLTEKEYAIMRSVKEGREGSDNFVVIPMSIENNYTQICKECYEKEKW